LKFLIITIWHIIKITYFTNVVQFSKEIFYYWDVTYLLLIIFTFPICPGLFAQCTPAIAWESAENRNESNRITLHQIKSNLIEMPCKNILRAETKIDWFLASHRKVRFKCHAPSSPPIFPAASTHWYNYKVLLASWWASWKT